MSNTRFVLAWMQAREEKGGVKQVAKSVGISTAYASIRASKLRSEGLELPRMLSARTNG